MLEKTGFEKQVSTLVVEYLQMIWWFVDGWKLVYKIENEISQEEEEDFCMIC